MKKTDFERLRFCYIIKQFKSESSAESLTNFSEPKRMDIPDAFQALEPFDQPLQITCSSACHFHFISALTVTFINSFDRFGFFCTHDLLHQNILFGRKLFQDDQFMMDLFAFR